MEDSTLEGLAKLLKQVRGSTDTPKGYDDGGPVTPDDQDAGTSTDGAEQDNDQAGPSFADKLKAVLAAMTNSPAAKIAGVVSNPMGALMSGGTNAILGGAAQAEAPVVNKAVIPAVNAMSGASIPQMPTAQTPPPVAAAQPTGVGPAQMDPQIAAQVAAHQQADAAQPKPVAKTPGIPDSSAAPTNPGSGPVANMLNTMTGGDPDKLQQVLGQLKDQQTRGQFAKALAIIGDTFANRGLARAGREPQGFKGLQAVTENNNATQANLVENMKTQLANDPNSQTSRFAQQAAANILGIKPGDPRMAGLAKAPAAVLSAQLPSLGDSVKPQLEREAQALQAHQFEESKHMQAQQLYQQEQDRKAQRDIAQMGADTAREHEKTETANSAVEHLNPINPWNWGTIGAAKNTIQNAVGGQPAAPVQTTTLHGKTYSKINGKWIPHQ